MIPKPQSSCSLTKVSLLLSLLTAQYTAHLGHQLLGQAQQTSGRGDYLLMGHRTSRFIENNLHIEQLDKEKNFVDL